MKIILNILRIIASPIFLVIILDRTLDEQNVQWYLSCGTKEDARIIFWGEFWSQFNKEYKEILLNG